MKQHLVGIAEQEVKIEVQLIALVENPGELTHKYALQVRVAGDIADLEEQPVFQALPAMLQSELVSAMEQVEQWGLESQTINVGESRDE